MKQASALLIGLCIGTLACGSAQAEKEQYATLEFSTDRQRLSNGSPDWTEHTAHWGYAFGKYQQVDISLLNASRFGLQDDQIQVNYSHPLSAKLNVMLDASHSATHRVLPQHSTGMTLQYEFAPRWLVYGGMKNTAYDSTTVEQTTLMLENYVSAFSWSVAWRPVRAFSTQTQTSELRGNYYYGEKNMVGIGWTSGQEASAVSANTLALANIESIVLTGRHWLKQNWAISYTLNSARQGNFYYRDGIRFGVQYIF